jgi:hypothetical protein
MALEFMHKAMLNQLQKNHASLDSVEKYEVVWASAMRNSGLPIPCPSCFVLGEISRLKPLPDQKGLSSARCLSCKTKFDWPSPE